MRSQFDDNNVRPDVNDMVAHASDVFKRNSRRFITLFIVLLGLAALIAGYVQVEQGEVAVIRTLGKETNRFGPGPHFIFPLVQRAARVNVEAIRRIEVGFRGDQRIADETQMLTGDENIVHAQMIVQYRVSDPSKYLFRLNDPEAVLRSTAEVALRSMVGRTKIDDVITVGRGAVEAETKIWLQKLIDGYESGVSVTEVKLQTVDAPDEVKDAFHDVVRAREEKEKLINQARGYAADLIPRARGEARQIEREAEGYKEKRVLEAAGDAARFQSVVAEYKKAPDVTRRRLYLETIERILAKTERKVVVDQAVARNALPLLQLNNQNQTIGAAAAVTAGGK